MKQEFQYIKVNLFCVLIVILFMLFSDFLADNMFARAGEVSSSTPIALTNEEITLKGFDELKQYDMQILKNQNVIIRKLNELQK